MISTSWDILLDVDGVLCDFFGAARQHLEDCGFTPAKFQETNLRACLTDPEFECFEEWGLRPGTCENLPRMPDAQWFIACARRVGEIYAVTAPWKGSWTWAKERQVWLQRNFEIDYDHVLHVPPASKHMVRGDVLIEDTPSTADAWGKRYGNAVLLSHHANQLDRERMGERTNYTTCKDLAHALEMLK